MRTLVICLLLIGPVGAKELLENGGIKGPKGWTNTGGATFKLDRKTGHRKKGSLYLTRPTLFDYTATLTHVGAATEYDAADVVAQFPAGFESAEHDAWLLSASADLSAAALSVAAFALEQGVNAATGMGGTDEVLLYSTGFTAVSATKWVAIPAGGTVGLRSGPVRIEPGATMKFRSSSTGNLTTQITAHFWIGPIGTTPPGMM